MKTVQLKKRESRELIMLKKMNHENIINLRKIDNCQHFLPQSFYSNQQEIIDSSNFHFDTSFLHVCSEMDEVFSFQFNVLDFFISHIPRIYLTAIFILTSFLTFTQQHSMTRSREDPTQMTAGHRRSWWLSPVKSQVVFR